jgi:hypothetical protein
MDRTPEGDRPSVWAIAGHGTPRNAISLIRALRASRSVGTSAASIACRTASCETPSARAFARRLAGPPVRDARALADDRSVAPARAPPRRAVVADDRRLVARSQAGRSGRGSEARRFGSVACLLTSKQAEEAPAHRGLFTLQKPMLAVLRAASDPGIRQSSAGNYST